MQWPICSHYLEHAHPFQTSRTTLTIPFNLPLSSQGGPTNLITFDIHALSERFFFGDAVVPCLETAIPLLKERLKRLPAGERDIVIAYPDEGARKRFYKLFRGYPEIICTKVREGDNRIVRIKEGEEFIYQGGGEPRVHVVIVDDLVQSGRTLIECQRVISSRGSVQVSAFVTHGVFPGRSWMKFCNEEEFKYFWITDSCPQTVRQVAGVRPFEILSLAVPTSRVLSEIGCLEDKYE